MTCGFSEEELFILHKICFMGRNCPKHVAKRDLVHGVPSSSCKQYSKAIESLIKKGYLVPYKSQGRDDVCFYKARLFEVIQALRAHVKQYPFIKNLAQIELTISQKIN
jgi:hypothetical protein